MAHPTNQDVVLIFNGRAISDEREHKVFQVNMSI